MKVLDARKPNGAKSASATRMAGHVRPQAKHMATSISLALSTSDPCRTPSCIVGLRRRPGMRRLGDRQALRDARAPTPHASGRRALQRLAAARWGIGHRDKEPPDDEWDLNPTMPETVHPAQASRSP